MTTSEFIIKYDVQSLEEITIKDSDTFITFKKSFFKHLIDED